MTLRLGQQLRLEARVGDAQQRGNDLGVGFSPQVGAAVLGDDDIAQVTWHGVVPIGEADVRLHCAVLLARGAQAQDGARTRKVQRLHDEVELAAHAADHAAVLECVGDSRSEQGHHHGRIDEARVAPLQAPQLAIGFPQRVDAAHGAHLEQCAVLRPAVRAARHRTPADPAGTRPATQRPPGTLPGKIRRRSTPARYRSSSWSTNISLQANRPVVNGSLPPTASSRLSRVRQCKLSRWRHATIRCAGGAAASSSTPRRRVRRCRSAACRHP